MKHLCRHCRAPLSAEVLDLGEQPPSNAYLTADQLERPEVKYPMQLYVCTNCWLVQLPTHIAPELLFTDDYAYFSRTSASWCDHAKKFAGDACKRLKLDAQSRVLEIASNDGYLLQFFNERGIPCLGVEPTKATAEAAESIGVETLQCFFGVEVSERLEPADLIIANNVLAHVPDINDFVDGLSRALKPGGSIALEFPHLMRLIEGNQFDTIYHEHYSYLSLSVVSRIAGRFGLAVTDVEELATHGGSLRVWLQHEGAQTTSDAVQQIVEAEIKFGLETLEVFGNFQERASSAALALTEFLVSEARAGRRVIGYGAAAKGNTLLNYAGVTRDILPAVCDKALSKQGKYLPGSQIPIISLSEFEDINPAMVLILPWNLLDEISSQWPDKNYAIAIPSLQIR
ncbi:class I SAM-dependent methyltransferase [Luminiphilus sp.]|nr:class I SAM-dependent methyltransferase [Luminiphilus sp.]